jgi:hypothetical protein
MPAMTIRSLAGGLPPAPSALDVIMFGSAIAAPVAFINDLLDTFTCFIESPLLLKINPTMAKRVSLFSQLVQRISQAMTVSLRFLLQ